MTTTIGGKKSSRRLIISFAICATLAFIGALVSSILLFVLPNITTAILITLMVCIVVLLVFVVLAVTLGYSLLKDKARQEIASHYFVNRNILFSDYVLEKMLDDNLKRHRVKPSVVVSFSISGFEDTIVNVFGKEYANKVLDTIALYLKERYEGDSRYHCAHDYVDAFIIVKETEDIDDFKLEFADLLQHILERISALEIVIQCDFIAGGTTFDMFSRIDAKKIIANATTARKWNEDRELNMIVFYENYMSGSLINEVGLVSDIDHAITNNEFKVYYQPKFDMNLNRFTSAEALSRWNHPQRGIISPIAFIKLAEKTGKIIDIDKYVFDSVCRDITRWKNNRMRLLTISCNLSRRTIHDDKIISYIKETLEKYQVNPLLIEFEITETVASQDMVLVYSIVKQLKELGVKVSIDDMGTGYSSFATLKRLPFDAIKIDKSFFDDIEVDKRARDVASTIADLGMALNMTVVAEGIQNIRQVEIVKKMNIDLIQGYYYSRPLPIHIYEAFIEKNKFEDRKGKQL